MQESGGTVGYGYSSYSPCHSNAMNTVYNNILLNQNINMPTLIDLLNGNENAKIILKAMRHMYNALWNLWKFIN